jgi:phosphate transport system permease protein
VSAPTVSSAEIPVEPKPVQQRGDRVFAGLARGAGIIILLVLAGVAAFLIIQAIPALFAPPDQLPGGQNVIVYVAPLVFGTLLSSIIALVIATPLAVAVALFITHYAPRRLAQGLGYVIDLLAAVPSIVYGLWGRDYLLKPVAGLAAWLHRYFGWIPLFGSGGPYGKSILLGSLVLAIMVLPIVTSLSRDTSSALSRSSKSSTTTA